MEKSKKIKKKQITKKEIELQKQGETWNNSGTFLTVCTLLKN